MIGFQRWQLCCWNANSASQSGNYSKSPKWSPGVKTLNTFVIWPKCCTEMSYLGTWLLDELKYFFSLIYNYQIPFIYYNFWHTIVRPHFTLTGKQYSSDCSLVYNNTVGSQPTCVAVYTHKLCLHKIHPKLDLKIGTWTLGKNYISEMSVCFSISEYFQNAYNYNDRQVSVISVFWVI